MLQPSLLASSQGVSQGGNTFSHNTLSFADGPWTSSRSSGVIEKGPFCGLFLIVLFKVNNPTLSTGRQAYPFLKKGRER